MCNVRNNSSNEWFIKVEKVAGNFWLDFSTYRDMGLETSQRFWGGPSSCPSLCQFYQRSMSIFLRTQIPKAQKKYSPSVSFFALLGSAHAKAGCRMLIKLTPGVNFINMLTVRSYSCKGSSSQLVFRSPT